MSDPLTAAIRSAVAELVEAAPLPPELKLSVGHRKPRRPRLAAMAIAVVLVAALLVAGVSILGRDRSGTTVAASGPTGSGALNEESIGTDSLPDPTFVRPAHVPAGLRFVEGGSNRLPIRGRLEILLAGPGNQSARLLWMSPSGCGGSAPVTTARTPTPQAGSGSALGVGPSEAAFVVSDGTGSLHWCNEKMTDINLITTGLDEAAARALAATVQPVPGRPTDLTVRVPPEFVAARPSAAGLSYTLAFGPDQSTAAKPALTIHIVGAWTTNLRLLEAHSGLPTPSEVDIGGRRGFSGQLPGGPRYQSVTVVFDDRTIVELTGDGLSADQLVSAAASLGPDDPSTAPDVSGDPQRCQRLGMCG